MTLIYSKSVFSSIVLFILVGLLGAMELGLLTFRKEATDIDQSSFLLISVQVLIGAAPLIAGWFFRQKNRAFAAPPPLGTVGWLGWPFAWEA